ncbi:MAG: EthD family reductase [Acidobacteria bacterium]|nr:EthD family reductase [Acidobacteriota bacterium]
MVIVSVLYPKTADSRFDHDYYLKTHTPLVKSTWTPTGLERVDIFRGVSSLDGAPPAYELIAHLAFTSKDHLDNSLAAGAAVIADIANFTNVQPVIQVNQPVDA